MCSSDLLGLLLSPGDAKCKLADLEGIGRAQQLENVGKLCQTGTIGGRTKADVSGDLLAALAGRGVPAGSFSGQKQALCDLVIEHGLEVDTSTGGSRRRTNEDIVCDILSYASTPEYKARLVREYTNGYRATATTTATAKAKATTTARTTTSEALDPVRTNLFAHGWHEEEKAEDPVVLDVRPPRPATATATATATAATEPAAASITNVATADEFRGATVVRLFTWLGLLIGVALWQWYELALWNLKLAVWHLQGLSIRSYGVYRFLQTLQSLDLHAPALELTLPGAAAALRMDWGTALLVLGAALGWLIVLVAAARQSGRAKVAAIPTSTRPYPRSSTRARSTRAQSGTNSGTQHLVPRPPPEYQPPVGY